MKISSINNNHMGKKTYNKSLSFYKTGLYTNAVQNLMFSQNTFLKTDSHLSLQNFKGYFGINSRCNINFGAKENKNSEDPALDFGISLFNKIMLNHELNLIDETKNFLKQNDMEDIQIKNLSEIDRKIERIFGGFQPNFSEDMGYQGGNLYLRDHILLNDAKACAKVVGDIAHELSHAYTHKKDNGIEVFRKLGANKKDLAKTITSFIEFVKQESVIRDLMQTKPLEYAINNFDKTGIETDEIVSFNPDIYRYGTIFPKTGVEIDEKTIMHAFSCDNEESFKKLVANYFAQTIFYFKNSDVQESYKNYDTYNLMRDYSVSLLRDEAIAYKKNSQVIKKYRGLPLNTPILNDLIPMTYNMVADTLEKIDVEKECA